MKTINFITTQDGSLGLYSEEVHDIYHSSYGAHWESLTKFVRVGQLTEFANDHEQIKILDICYGIGYNTKTAIDEILKVNGAAKIFIDALEIDENLILISPLLSGQKIDNRINKIIMSELLAQNLYSFAKLSKICLDLPVIRHLNIQNLAFLIKLSLLSTIKTSPLHKLSAFLHKIYYNYITSRNKLEQKRPENPQISLKFLVNDARKTVLELDCEYDYIFLDAFTPKKLPTLWTYDFFKELYRLLDEGGMLITYSTSAAVRGAMLEAGFCVGKSLSPEGKVLGTVATKQEHLIKYKLDDFEYGLLKTRAGIFYRDEGLDNPPDKIIALRASETASSQRQTTSRYKKDYAKL